MNAPGAPTRGRPADERGQAAVLMALMLVVLLGFAALVIDVGYAYYVKRSLQASADAAALAGAQELPDPAAAEAVAENYSGIDGSKNERVNVPDVEITADAKCMAIAPCRPANAITVTQTAEVQTKFARLLGVEDFEVRATSTACFPCASRPLDIMLVLDRTLSMCMNSNGTYNSACTDLNNAKAGIRTFLGFLDPTLDHVGLAVFPPARNLTTTRKCESPGMDYYNTASFPYVIVPMSSDYKTGFTLNTSSNLVSTLNCLQAGGITSYATTLEKAQAELDRHDGVAGRDGIQDVIVFFSDGAANTGPTYYPMNSPYRKQPCQQGVWSAAAIKDAPSKTLIYSIGYDLNASDNIATFNVCRAYNYDGPMESPAITAYQALQQIASPGSFYNQPNAGELNSIYTAIAGELTGTRLLDDE